LILSIKFNILRNVVLRICGSILESLTFEAVIA
jgi:hypothetical protein